MIQDENLDYKVKGLLFILLSQCAVQCLTGVGPQLLKERQILTEQIC